MHDLGFVMCSLDKNGINISADAQRAFDTGVSDIFINNIIWPAWTLSRMIKYNKRYGIKYYITQVAAMAGLYSIDVAPVLDICVNQ